MRQSIVEKHDFECYICGSMRNLQIHHCIHGNKRKLADREGLTVHLCLACHHRLHSTGLYDLELKQAAQMAWQRVHHADAAAFRALFGRSYL